MESKLLKITDVADVLQVSRVTVWNKIKGGKLKALRVGRDYRIFESDLMAYVANCNNKTEGECVNE